MRFRLTASPLAPSSIRSSPPCHAATCGATSGSASSCLSYFRQTTPAAAVSPVFSPTPFTSTETIESCPPGRPGSGCGCGANRAGELMGCLPGQKPDHAKGPRRRHDRLHRSFEDGMRNLTRQRPWICGPLEAESPLGEPDRYRAAMTESAPWATPERRHVYKRFARAQHAQGSFPHGEVSDGHIFARVVPFRAPCRPGATAVTCDDRAR